jgi:hypothetical protein
MHKRGCLHLIHKLTVDIIPGGGGQRMWHLCHMAQIMLSMPKPKRLVDDIDMNSFIDGAGGEEWDSNLDLVLDDMSSNPRM